MECVDIAIVGGGMGGLALAAGLTSKGFDAHVFEAAPSLRTATSTIISLGQNALRALGQLNESFPDLVKSNGTQLQTVRGITRIPGCKEEVKEFDNPTIWVIVWAKMQEILAAQVPETNVHGRHRCVGYKEDPELGQVHVLFKDKPAIRAKLVVAADGARSTLRKQMWPADPGQRYLGQMNFNSLLRNPSSKLEKLHDTCQLISIRDGPVDTFGLHVYLQKPAEGIMFWQVRVTSEQPAWTQTPGGPGMGVPGSKARVLGLLEEAGWQDVAEVVEATPEGEIYERVICDVLPLPRWSTPSKRVVLLGDAAHNMHPGPGQGARMAFEDAHQLYEALLAHWPADLAAAISQYEAARVQRCAIVQRFAAAGARVLHAKPPVQVGMSEYKEFSQWVDQYPLHPGGDPNIPWMAALRIPVDDPNSGAAGQQADRASLQDGNPYVAGELPAYMYGSVLAADDIAAAEASGGHLG